MVPVNDEKTEFKYVFNKHYEMLERMALMGERSMDIATAQEVSDIIYIEEQTSDSTF